MCHLSPTVHLAWATLACGLQIFLGIHLWRYDRFKCISWSSGRQPGAFKRIMTYSYLTSVPSLVAFSVAMVVLKYRNGYIFVPGFGIIPTPIQFWPQADQDWLQPLYILFGVTWGLEIVTHLEELTFWLFLLHQGPTRRDWFSSFEFKIWAIGSCIGMVGMPVTAVLTRTDPIRAEAWIFLIGSAASTVVTVLFFIVLYKFPDFLCRVKKEGAATAVVLRLVKFHELNIIRVICRLFMTIPLLILGIDGVHGHHIINESAFWTDMLAFLSGVGTIASSAMTLLIFFPRSLAEDSNWRPRTQDSQSHAGSFISASSGLPDRNRHVRSLLSAKLAHPPQTRAETASPNPFSDEDTLDAPTLSSMPASSKSKPRYFDGHFTSPSPLTAPYYPPRNVNDASDYDSPVESPDGRLNPWRSGPDLERGLEDPDTAKTDDHHGSGAIRGGKNSEKLKVRMIELGEVVEAGLKKPQRPPRLHPYIATFTSPIDLIDWHDESVPRAL